MVGYLAEDPQQGRRGMSGGGRPMSDGPGSIPGSPAVVPKAAVPKKRQPLLPKAEYRALRNAACVGLVFALLKGRGREGLRHPEVWRMAAATGLVAELYARVQNVSGNRGVGGVASVLSLRVLLDQPSFHFNYKFLSAYFTSQALVQYLASSTLRHTLLMMFSAGSLLGSWVLNDRLPLSYIRFLDREGKIDRPELLKLRRVFRNDSGDLTWRELRTLSFPRPGGVWLTEKYGTDSIVGLHRAFAEYFLRHVREAIPFYFKIYLLRLVVQLVRLAVKMWNDRAAAARRRRRRVDGSPPAGGGRAESPPASPKGGLPLAQELPRRVTQLCTSVVRSSVFLSLYCSLAWYSVGMCGHLIPNVKSNALGLYLATTIPGLAILLETPSQKETIANYCATFGAYPLLSLRPGLYDAAMVATAVACSTGAAPRPFLLNILWPDDDVGPPPTPSVQDHPLTPPVDHVLNMTETVLP